MSLFRITTCTSYQPQARPSRQQWKKKKKKTIESISRKEKRSERQQDIHPANVVPTNRDYYLLARYEERARANQPTKLVRSFVVDLLDRVMTLILFIFQTPTIYYFSTQPN